MYISSTLEHNNRTMLRPYPERYEKSFKDLVTDAGERARQGQRLGRLTISFYNKETRAIAFQSLPAPHYGWGFVTHEIGDWPTIQGTLESHTKELPNLRERTEAIHGLGIYERSVDGHTVADYLVCLVVNGGETELAAYSHLGMADNAQWFTLEHAKSYTREPKTPEQSASTQMVDVIMKTLVQPPTA
jgi:hypothetical protein